MGPIDWRYAASRRSSSALYRATASGLLTFIADRSRASCASRSLSCPVTVSNACFLAVISADSVETACCRHRQAAISAISGGNGTWALAAPGASTASSPKPNAIPRVHPIMYAIVPVGRQLVRRGPSRGIGQFPDPLGSLVAELIGLVP